MKKLLAVLMCSLMCIGLISTAAQAEEVTLYVVDINPDHEAYNAMIDAFEAAHERAVQCIRYPRVCGHSAVGN